MMNETGIPNIEIPKAKGMHFKAEPELTVGQEIYWRIPVRYCLPEIGELGIVGFLVIDVNTGEVLLSKSTPLEELAENAERLYKKKALQTGEDL